MRSAESTSASLARPRESDFPGGVRLTILGWQGTLDYLGGQCHQEGPAEEAGASRVREKMGGRGEDREDALLEGGPWARERESL